MHNPVPKHIKAPSCPNILESGRYPYTIANPHRYMQEIEIVLPINGNISEA